METFVRPLIIGLATALSLASGHSQAAEFKTLTLPDQTELTYAVAHPDGFDPQNEYPILLALPPGGQTTDMVRAGLDAYWEDEGTSRGFVVISPAAPNGELFMSGGRRHIAPFVDHIRATYRVAGGKIHLTGVSNGGLSAFAAAIDNRGAFQSVTVIPGFPPSREDFAALDRLAGLKINMFVGGNDGGWLDSMAATQAELKRLGFDSTYEVVPAEGHFVRSLTGANSARLFDQIQR